MRLRLVTTSMGFHAGLLGPLLVTTWEALPTAEQARAAGELLTTLGRTEHRILLMSVLGAGAPPPDGTVRKIVASQISALSGRIVAVANVVEGEGFRGAATRAMLTGMALAMRPDYPHKTTATVEDAAQFLVNHSGGRLTTTDVVMGTRELRNWEG